MLKINNVEMPTPKDVVYSRNKLWSENTGRLDNGNFSGDLIGVKRKYDVTFPPLTTAQIAAIITATDAASATVVITNAAGSTDTVTAYFGDLTFKAYSWKNGLQYTIDAAISIIEV